MPRNVDPENEKEAGGRLTVKSAGRAGSRDIWGKAQLHPNFGQRWIKEISGSQKLSFFANGFQKFKTNQGMVRAR